MFKKRDPVNKTSSPMVKSFGAILGMFPHNG
jgi:hypothetical protein